MIQVTIGGRFAPLAMLVDKDADLDSMVTHFNKAVTDTAAELLGKQCWRRKPWVTPEILYLWDQRRDLMPGSGSMPQKESNSKKAYQLVKDLTTEKQGKSTTIQDKSGKCLTEENEILNRWTEYCSETQ